MPRFADIPRLITGGSYEIHVPLMSIERTLNEFRQSYNLDMDPDFQRGHVWDEVRQIRYMEFILRSGKSSRVIYFNDPTFGRAPDDTDIPNMVLIDGKQRLESVRRFVSNEIAVFDGYFFRDFEDRPSPTGHALLFNVNSLGYRREILTWYLDLNSGGVVHTDDEIERVRALLAAEPKRRSQEG